MKKAISPLIASVLLIAFTITVATIIASWVTTFTTGQTELTEEKAKQRITCAFGSLNIEEAKYNNTETKLFLRIENTQGDMDLSNITFNVIMKNASTFFYHTTCNCNDETLRSAEIKIYSNSSVADGCNIDMVRVSTNCPDAYDDVYSSQITFSGC